MIDVANGDPSPTPVRGVFTRWWLVIMYIMTLVALVVITWRI
jgi:hypothetical protein